MSGSDNEPVVPLPESAAEQWDDPADPLRARAWMVASLTSMPRRPTAEERHGRRSRYRTAASRASDGGRRGAALRNALPRVIRLDPDPASIRRARRFVADCVGDWGFAECADDVMTVSHELVVNALRHARGPIMLAVGRRSDRLVVQVEDESPYPPEPTRAAEGTLDDTGRGLLLVEQLSADWGTTAVGTGKRVWAELLVHPED